MDRYRRASVEHATTDSTFRRRTSRSSEVVLPTVAGLRPLQIADLTRCRTVVFIERIAEHLNEWNVLTSLSSALHC